MRSRLRLQGAAVSPPAIPLQEANTIIEITKTLAWPIALVIVAYVLSKVLERK